MRWRAPILAVALSGLAPSSAAAEGSVVIAWRSDPARCAPAGLCGVRGAVAYVPAIVVGEGLGRSDLPSVVPQRAPVARVDGATGSCVDALAGDVLELDFVPDGRLVPVDEGSAAGRCAGPTFADIRDALPRAARDPSGGLDLHGRRPFSAGPLMGEVTSSLVLRPSRAAAGAPRARAARPQRRTVEYAVTYRIANASGAFGVEFHGAGDPACRPLDACGAIGRVTHSVDLRGRRIVLKGRRPFRGRRPPPLHAGISLYGTIRAPGAARTTAEVARPGAATCRDATAGTPARFGVELFRDHVRAGFEVDDEMLDALDPVRTRCPGPTRADALGDAPLARGGGAGRGSPPARLRLRLPFRGAFAAPGYAGVRRGGMVLDLRRTRIRTRVLGAGS